MNKVKDRCQKDGCAKFLYASKRMYAELKYTKIFMYLLNIVPVVICFLPSSDELIKIICSCVSFSLTLIAEVVSSFLSSYKEKAILEHQLYETEITGSPFSKTEYDRELTNELNELAIRKAQPKMRKASSYPVTDVPSEITDDHSYLYLCRVSAAQTKYIMSRMFFSYLIALVVIGLVFISVNFVDTPTGETLYLLICFWPLIIPLIRNCTSCAKCVRQCVKLCDDIDEFFSDGDDSVERLARFYYYVQNIEFEMMLTRPTIYALVRLVLKRGLEILTEGVTARFKEALVELKSRDLMMRGVISQPRGKMLITKPDYDLETLEKASAKPRKKSTDKKRTETKKSSDGKKGTKKKSSAKPKGK